MFLGLVPFGLYALRTDPGTPLHTVVTLFRDSMGLAICLIVGVVEQLLEALGFMEVSLYK